jgi:hypothetical protein
MLSSHDDPTTFTGCEQSAESLRLLGNTLYALVLKGQDPSTVEWMTSESATAYLQSGEKPPIGAKLKMRCPVCHSEFMRPVGKVRENKEVCAKQRHACSVQCGRELYRWANSVELVCHECSKEFRLASAEYKRRSQRGNKEFFCSNACYGAYRSRVYQGEAHHRYSKVAMVCTQCGEEFKRKQAHATTARTQTPFCSHTCYHQWLRENGGIRTLVGSSTSLGARSYPKEFKWLRERIMAMKPRCIACGVEAVDVHHLDGDKDNNEFMNLVPVCRSCHTRHHQYQAIPALSPSSASTETLK